MLLTACASGFIRGFFGESALIRLGFHLLEGFLGFIGQFRAFSLGLRLTVAALSDSDLTFHTWRHVPSRRGLCKLTAKGWTVKPSGITPRRLSI